MPTALPFQASDSQLRLELDQGWEFVADPTAKLMLGDLGSVTGWRSARAGLSWNVQFNDLRDYMGAAWYRIHFEVPFTRNVRHVLLKFGAVDYFCEVYLNGTLIGSHEGGYTPFSFDLSSAVQKGDNELVLRVIDPPMDEKQNRELFPDMLYNEIPHGKQNWYVQNSGMWQGVRLEFTPAMYVDRVDVTPRIDGNFRLDIKLAGEALQARAGMIENTRLCAIIYDNAGRVVWEKEIPLSGDELLQIEGAVHNPRLWGPEQAALYTVDILLRGAVSYRRRTRFGFRELRATDGKLLLNGKPFYMIAALDQDFYPETIHTPASAEFVREMMLKAKRLGVNVLRCHLKVAHPVYLDVANEVGMLVWAELPSWSDCWFPADHFSEKAAHRAERMFEEMMLRDWNHPCLVIQTIMNESWGINLKDEMQRAWLKATFTKIKGILEPLGRLVIDNSACEGNFHLKTDIEDFHNYYSQPDQSPLWDKFITEFSSRAGWTYSPYGDEERTGREPLVVSEFGNWGLPQLPEELPWWFNASFGEREVTRPGGVFERFREFKLDRIFSDYNEFAIESQWHQFSSLKYEIESMRRQNALQGYCVTGMTDVHWEVNGLLDMWRNEKVFSEDLRRLQQPDIVVASLPKSNFFAGEQVDVPVLLSHFREIDVSGGRLQWSLESSASGSLQLTERMPPGSVCPIGSLHLTIPDVEAPTRLGLRLELRARQGSLLAENSYSVFAYPKTESLLDSPIHLYDPLGSVAETADALRNFGYDVHPVDPGTPASGVLIVSSILDDVILNHMQAGAPALVLADSEHAFAEATSLTCLKRSGNWLDGRWFSNYNWIDPSSEPYRELGFSRILGAESREVVPEYVIGNVAGTSFHNAIAGITLGWVQLNHPLTLQVTVGNGRALLTTFRFPQIGNDPYATHLFHAYLRHVASGSWTSALQLPAEATSR